MSYVIYHKNSTRIHKDKVYKTMAAAQATLTKMNNAYRKDIANPIEDAPLFQYGVAEYTLFKQMIEKRVLRTNLMTGKEYYEDANTPWACSPASETYWSS
jgi:hypothetical protein